MDRGCCPTTGFIFRNRTYSVGRMQIFNNWSPYLVADPATSGSGWSTSATRRTLWKQSDAAMIEMAKSEVEKIGIMDRADVLDAVVIRVPKTYPAYFGSLRAVRRNQKLHKPVRESVSGGPQRHAQVQQSGSFDADRDDGGGQHHRGTYRQEQHLGSQHRNGISRKQRRKINRSADHAVVFSICRNHISRIRSDQSQVVLLRLRLSCSAIIFRTKSDETIPRSKNRLLSM